MKRIFTYLKALVCAFLFVQVLPSASAGELAREPSSHSEAILYLESSTLRTGTNWLAFHVVPREGWHTYWKNPGDSGAAPIFDWQLPEGVTAGKAQFQVPEKIPVAHLMNYGYSTASTILVSLEIDESLVGGQLSIPLAIEWLVCEVECVPQIAEWSFEFTVDSQSAMDPVTANVFAAARAAMPDYSYWSGDLRVGTASSELLLHMSDAELADVTGAYYFPEEEGIVTYAAEQTVLKSNKGLQLRLPRAQGALNPAHGNGLISFIYADGSSAAFELEPMFELVEVPEAAASSSAISVALPLWQAALYAFLGGLVLNLMPCVFPVLSLKAFAFVSANYKTEANRRREGWAYTLGIWVSFMLIVLVLQFLRAGGAAIGWGFQLQEPLFIAFMTAIMVMVALSLAGMFNISFGVEGAGQQLASREGAQGAFFKGVLAALVATPCTAPLMAPAIGYALTQPLLVVITVFSLLALGLAVPFLLLSYSSKLASLMPKPGAWMETVKQVLAFPMLLTAAWLLYVFDLQAGATATLALIVSLILLVFALWVATHFTGKSAKPVAAVIALSVLVGFASVSSDFKATEAPTSSENAFSRETLAELRSAGTPVFVYFTAEWCITCKVNEQVALFRDETQQAFTDRGITVLKGDWTNRNDEIAEVLASYGRAGVPLYLYFPAGAEDAIVLPEVLTVGSILEVL